MTHICVAWVGGPPSFQWRLDTMQLGPEKAYLLTYAVHVLLTVDLHSEMSSIESLLAWDFMGIQHPSPNVKNPLLFEPSIWLEMITSRDAKSALCLEHETRTGVLANFSREVANFKGEFANLKRTFADLSKNSPFLSQFYRASGNRSNSFTIPRLTTEHVI